MSRLRLRWRIAYALNRLPGQCWTDLVGWAMHNGQRTPWSPIRSCRQEVVRTGSCYCGKLRAPESQDGAA